MALHGKHSRQGDINDDVYSSVDLSVSMPKYKFPQTERDPRHAYAVVHDELMLDGNARQNLATFCQTWEEPEIHQLMNECIDKNMVDKDVIRRRRKSRRAVSTCWLTYGTHRGGTMEWVALPPDPAKRPCWVGWG